MDLLFPQKVFYVYRYTSTISQSPLVLGQIDVLVELINMHELGYYYVVSD